MVEQVTNRVPGDSSVFHQGLTSDNKSTWAWFTETTQWRRGSCGHGGNDVHSVESCAQDIFYCNRIAKRGHIYYSQIGLCSSKD